MGCHALDDGYLLVVFLAEIGAVWTDGCEEFADYLAYSVEVPGAACSFHDGVGRWVGEGAGVGLGIHLFNAGGKCYLCSALLEQLTVCVEGAGVALEIFGVVELGGVEEYADDGDVVLSDGASHE